MVLGLLVLTVHPFELPDVNRAIEVELLPPLTPPPTPEVDVDLRPRQDEPKPQPLKLTPVRPEAPALPRAVEVKPQLTPQPRQLLDVARPSQPELQNPVEIQRRAVQAPRLQTQQATPQIPEAPPEPVTVTRPAPVLPPSPEAARAPVQRTAPLDTSRAAPQIPEASAPAESAAPQVLTNQTVIQAPVEIRPRDRAVASPRLTTEGAAPDIPAAGGGGAPPAGAGSAGAGGASANARSAIEGIQGGFGPGGLKGLRATIGCEDPDAYKLTAEERAACRQRFAQGAKGAPDFGLNIPARKQAEFDRAVACKASTIAKGIPNEGSATPGSSIPGLGVTPSLKECGPGER